jgi:DNA-binding response OmpR family regulator
MRILVVEDERKIALFVQRGLKECGFVVDIVYRGDEALEIILDNHFDAVILDIMLPGRDGLSILRVLRQRSNPVPVLILTARGEIPERVEGLDLGADDYLAKPFSIDELAARVRALIRREPRPLSCARSYPRRGYASGTKRGSANKSDQQRIFLAGVFDAESGSRVYPNAALPTRLGISFRP